MTNSKRLINLVLLLLMFSAFACNKTEDGSYVEPITSYERIKGITWELSSVKQIDEIAIASGIEPNELSLTSKFNFKTMAITFEADSVEHLVPTTYKVEGSAPEIFPKEGYWGMNTAYALTSGESPVIYLYSDAEKTNQVAELSVMVMPAKRTVLELKLLRKSGGNTFLSYHMAFKPE